MNRVLVVDDEPDVLAAVRGVLEKYGFAVACVPDAERAMEEVGAFAPDLIILDILMPGTSGKEFCLELRKTRDVPIIFLSGLDSDVDRIVGLELGADDYLTKPFHPGELLARVRAVLRRTARAPRVEPRRDDSDAELIEHAGVCLDLDRHEVRVGDEVLDLTKTEFELLKTLMRRPTHVCSRDEIIRSVYGPATYISDRTINSHIRRVRSKLEECGIDPIETVRGVGYRMVDPG